MKLKMDKVTNHKDLKVWKESMDFVALIYQVTDNFPASETCGLTSQLKRASVSIPSNIAEGFARKGKLELFHFFVYIFRFSIGNRSTN